MDYKQPMVFAVDIEAELPQRISNGFQKYADFKSLEKGGKSKLVSCKDTNLGRRVLLKMLHPDLAQNQEELKRLIREARITAQLQHPATVPLYEVGQTDDGEWYFAMKNIEGRTLFDIIVGLSRGDAEIEARFGLNRLLTILTQVGDALAYAHARGVVHRDVKPENIIVGMFGEVTLIDWGTAKIQGAEGLPEDKDPLLGGGTPLYMSPEQVAGNRETDERSDIFSLGVVMYEMLAQREPFRGTTIQQTFDNIINKLPVPPREAAPHRVIPGQLEAICLKAIAKKPEDRFPTMQVMMDEIQQFLSDSLAQWEEPEEPV